MKKLSGSVKMKQWENVSLVDYTEKEEKLNALTHTAGLILSGFIIARCLIPSIESRDLLRIICAFLYFFGTTVMFITSALYHSAKKPERKKMLRLLDHCMIFFAVAGTATGCVPAVYDTVGITAAVIMAGCAWFGALGGLFLTFFSFDKTRGLQMGLYIGTSLVCAIAGGKAYKILPKDAFFALLSGGTVLLSGAAIYGAGKKKRWLHTVFHLFIDAGLTIFFIGIQRHCY